MKTRCLLPLFLFALSAQALPPVVLIPGIGGSMLQAENEAVWINLEDLALSLINYEDDASDFADYTDNTFRKYMLGKYKDGGAIEPVFSAINLTVPYSLNGKGPIGTTCNYNKKLGGLCGIEYLVDLPDTNKDSVWSAMLNDLLESSDADYFAEMVSFLEGEGYQAGSTLFGFPYDWRISVRNADTLARLDALLKVASQNGQNKVAIISHSMGCLVVKSYMQLYAQNAAKYIEKWIAVAGPFQGAAGNAVSAIFSGYAIGQFEICDCSARELAVQSAGSLELMANDWLENNFSTLSLRVPSENGNSKQLLGKTAILDLAEEVYQNHTFTFENVTKPWPFSAEARAWADGTWAILSNGTIPSSVQMYAIYGSGLQTPYNVSYAGALPCNLDCEQNKCYNSTDCTVSYASTQGDGTVPENSAKYPFGDENNEPEGLVKYEVYGLDHFAIIKDWKYVFPAIAKWLNSKNLNIKTPQGRAALDVLPLS